MAQPSVKITGGTGLDAAILSSNPVGTENALVVRMIPGSAVQPISGTVTSNQGTAGTLSNAWPFKLTDGTNTASITAGGSLNVNITGGTSNATAADNTSFTLGTSTVSTVSGVAFSGIPTAATGSDQAAIALTLNRAVHVSLRDTSGNALGVSANKLVVDGSGVTQPVSGTVTLGAGAATIGAISNTAFTANIGTTNGLALDATLTGGAAKFQLGNGTNYAALTSENSSYGLNVHINNASPISVSMSTAAAVTTTGSLAAANATVSAAVSAYDSALVTLKGTYAGVTVQFWVSDDSGTTYYPVTAVRTDTNLAANSFTLASNASVSYFVNVSGATNLQVKASAFASGSVSVRISPNGSSFSPNVVSAIVDNSGNVASITGSSLNANITNTVAASIVGGSVAVTGTVSLGTGAASIGTVILGAGSASVGTVTLGAGAAAIGSITNTSFAVTQASASALNATVVGSGTAGTPSGGVLSVQGVSGGTALKVDGSGVTQPVSGTVAFSNTTLQVTQATAANLNATVVGTVTANLGTIAGAATAVNQTNGTALTQISNGTNSASVVNAPPAYNAYALVTRNIDSAANYLHIAATGTVAATNVKASTGLLKAIVINTPGDTGGTLTIYDTASNTTTTVVAVIDLAVQPCTLTYGLALANGMAYAVSGITSSCDVTVLYA